MATGFPVKANYATGDVLTATNMNDLSGTVNYLQYMPPRNPILNSNFSCWQRGTSFAGTGSPIYTADRWNMNAASAQTFSRQATSDTTNLPNIQYCARIQRTNASTNTTAVYVSSSWESVNSIPYAGKTVTLSFYARVGANWAGTSFGVQLISGTGTDQNLNTGFTGSTNVISVSPTFTTTWQRFTYTGTVAATATQLGLLISWLPSGTAGAADYVEITGVQVELGSAANTYMPNQPTYATELAACKRYARMIKANAVAASGFAHNTTVCQFVYPLDTPMRSTTLSITQNTMGCWDGTNFYAGGTWAVAATDATPDQISSARIQYTHGSAVFTQFRPYFLQNTDANSYFLVSAEL